jgi:hypothetical protein
MKEQVENLLRPEKERIIASEKLKRDNHLRSIGLSNEKKTSRIYSDYDYQSTDFPLYDAEKKKYYKETIGALDVTDEEYVEICKYFPPKSDILGKDSKLGKEYPALSIISIISKVIGVVIILFAVIVLIYGFTLLAGYSSEMGVILIFSSLFCGLLFSVPYFAFSELIKVFVRIEFNTRNLKAK